MVEHTDRDDPLASDVEGASAYEVGALCIPGYHHRGPVGVRLGHSGGVETTSRGGLAWARSALVLAIQAIQPEIQPLQKGQCPPPCEHLHFTCIKGLPALARWAELGVRCADMASYYVCGIHGTALAAPYPSSRGFARSCCRRVRRQARPSAVPPQMKIPGAGSGTRYGGSQNTCS